MNIYLKSFIRGLRKRKLTTVINLFGFSIGLTLIMFIAVYLKNELGADRFHQNINSIYRVDSELKSKTYPLTAAPMADWLKDNFPVVKESARMFCPYYKSLYYATIGDQSFEINKPVFVDPAFFDIFSFPIKAGRITDDFDTKNTVILTEPLAAKLFGDENPVGKTIKYCGKNSLTHQPVGPLTIRLTNGSQTSMMIRTDVGETQGIPALISNIKNQIAEIVPDAYVEIKFLDDQIQHQYIKETRTQKLLGHFSFFAILISAMGLFGLVVLTTNQRIKEIGIRKVNGAKVSEILTMLNNDFVKWVVIAFVIATLIAYYAMHKWLESFAYKTELSWWIFALAGLLALGIALLTVSWQSWRAATRNPIEALRYE